jgi:putative nucleotidyltransferase with HDIG domain
MLPKFVNWSVKNLKIRIYSIYVALIIIISILLGLYIHFPVEFSLNKEFFIFAMLCAIADLLPVRLPRGGFVTVSFAVVYGCLLIAGPPIAAIVAIVGGLASSIQRRASLENTAFNCAQIFITVYMSGLVYIQTGGPIGDIGKSWSMFLPFMLGVIVYFVLNSSLVTLAVSLQRGGKFTSIWAGNIRRIIPSYVALTPTAYLIAVIYKNAGGIGLMFFLIPLLLARYSFKQYVTMREVYLGTISALAALVDAKDPYTRGHSERVRNMSVGIAQEMHIPTEYMELVEYAALLHDIGKIGIKESILNKPGPLSELEFAEIQNHPGIGEQVICKIDFLHEVSVIVRAHHERYDGLGYPDGKKGDEIPLGSRILSVADAYDAMISDRPYRKALSKEEAIRRLIECKDTQFDGQVVDAFIKVVQQRG